MTYALTFVTQVLMSEFAVTKLFSISMHDEHLHSAGVSLWHSVTPVGTTSYGPALLNGASCSLPLGCLHGSFAELV